MGAGLRNREREKKKSGWKFWSTKKEIKRNSPVRWEICSSLMRPTTTRSKQKHRVEGQVTSNLRMRRQ
ncbi:hypothetical protein FJTKL_05229 [Diaporthe vaccinii]|uniref:Uncharacterized protein n=1 Tax=Diaporthe vaccinii TaxID=105482 RepID=A0ABR4FF14_9PEZI